MTRLVVGLTGGIGTGKSAALAEFRKLGAAAVSADAVARRLSEEGGPLHRAVLREFGRRFLDPRGRLDRAALGEAVFRSPALRGRLERATHPRILREMRRLVRCSRRSVVVVDAPLLFEARAGGDYDLVLVVGAPPSVALRRVMRRDGLTRAQALRRMRAQWPIGRKAALADVVIDNSGGLRRLKAAARGYYRAFELLAGVRRN